MNCSNWLRNFGCSLFPRICQSRRRSLATLNAHENKLRVSKEDTCTSNYPSRDSSTYQALYVASPVPMASTPSTSTGNRDTGNNFVSGKANLNTSKADFDFDAYNYPDVNEINTSLSKSMEQIHDNELFHTYHSPNIVETDALNTDGYLVPISKTETANLNENPGDYNLYTYMDPLMDPGIKCGYGLNTPTMENPDYLEIDIGVSRNIASSADDPNDSTHVYQSMTPLM